MLLAFHFPPSRGSGVYRTLAWANRFAAAGWQVTVVTVSENWFHDTVGGVDAGLLELVDPSVRVVRTPLWHEAMRHDVATMSRVHANFPQTHARLSSAVARWSFPEQYGLWYPAATRAGLRAGLRARPDLVLATGNPYASHAAARAVARLLRTDFAVDYHDAWTLDQFSGEHAFPPGHRAWRWEGRLVRGAHRVFTVNEALAAWYRAQYPTAAGRVRVVENGWAPEVLADLPPPAPRPDGPVRFGYVGTLRRDLPLEPFFEGWRRARTAGNARGATLDLYGYLGYFATNKAQLSTRLPLGREGVCYRGPVSQRELARAYGDLDVLVSLLPSSPYVTSGKVYDYLAAARPIVAVHTQQTGATAAAAGYPLWFGMPEPTADRIATALEAAATAARQLSPDVLRQARAVAQDKTWAAQLDPAIVELSRG